MAVLGLLLIAGVIAFADFYSWRSDIVTEIETDPRRRIASTALGDIEYAIEGDGVLVLSGVQPDEENPVPELGNTMLWLADRYMWASATFFPSLLGDTLSDSFDADDPLQLAQVEGLARSMVRR